MKKDLATLQKELKILTYHMNMSGLHRDTAKSNFERIEQQFKIDYSKIWSELLQSSDMLDWVDWEKFSVECSFKYIFFNYDFGYGELTFFQVNINKVPTNLNNNIIISGSSELKYKDVVKRLELIQVFLKVAYVHSDIWSDMIIKVLNFDVERRAYQNHVGEFVDFTGQIQNLEDLIQAQSIERTFTFAPYSYIECEKNKLHYKSVDKFKEALIKLIPMLRDSFATQTVIITSTMNSIILKQCRISGGKYIPLLSIPINKPFVLSDKIFLRLKSEIN